MFQKLKEVFPKQFRFVLLAVLLFWLKTYFAYLAEFSLGIDGLYQSFLLFINPIASTLLILGLSLLFSNSKKGYRALLLFYFLNSLLLFSNILYYREFSDFITIKTVLSSSATMTGLGATTFQILRVTDVLYWLDFAFLLWIYRKKVKTTETEPPVKKRLAFTTILVSLLIFLANLGLAEIDRPQLLTRTFDRNYIVKYLGLNVYTLYDGIQTAQTNTIRASADSSDLAPVLDYVDNHYATPNEATFGQTENRNIVFIHLESIQQFLIDMSLPQNDGVEKEVLPFLNTLFHSNDSYSFTNFFHQTSQGKTSDAELLIDNSLFGLPQGSAFTQIGADNTFHAGPQILKDQGYSSAVFHANVGSFWDRDNVYKSMGYDYFFSSESSYTLTPENSLEYGLKDKLFFQESIQYLEKLPQPFYTKFITVSNHFPFGPDELNTVYDVPDTNDETVNGFFNTAHYADQALEEFFQYMRDSGLYDKTVFVLYGDHYGISNSRNKSLAPLLGADPNDWDSYDNAMLQRVPLIVHAPGIGTGGINETYSGQVDVLPTLLHLLGIDTQSHIQMGQDILSDEHDNMVVLRNGNVISPEYTLLDNIVYDTQTGEIVVEPDEAIVSQLEQTGQTQLSMSDAVLNGDLLRFYSPQNFTPAEKNALDYLDSPTQLLNEFYGTGDSNTSLFEQNGGESTVPLYETDAPEFPGTLSEILELEEEQVIKLAP